MTMLRNAVLALGFALIAAPASAVNISTSQLGAVGSQYSGMAVDPVTGKVYQSTFYTGTNIKAYASTATYDARQSSGNVAVGTHYGPYMAANDGSLYLRTQANNGLSISKVSAANGAVQKTVSVTGGMGGANFSDSFNWGGYSGVNLMNDGSRLYAVGGMAANNQWSIATFDYALNQTKSVSFDVLNGTAGYAFAVNGYVFFGDSYGSGHISRRVDAATGAVSVVDFTLTGLQSNPAISGISYDALHDSLYVLSNNGGSISKAVNLAQQLGVQRNAVPEPGTLAVFGLGLAALAAARRRKAG